MVTASDYNPLSRKLAQEAQRLQEMQEQLDRCERSVSWYKGFDLPRQASLLAGLDREIAERRATVATLQNACDTETDRIESLQIEVNQWEGWLGQLLRRRNEAGRRAKKELDVLEASHPVTQMNLAEARSQLRLLLGQRSQVADQVQEFASFDLPAAERSLQDSEAAVKHQSDKVASLLRRKEELDDRIAPHVARLQPALRRRQEVQAAMNELNRQIDELYRYRKEAFELSDRLNTAQTSYDRALLHQECKRRFGHGSPMLVAGECKDRIRALQPQRDYAKSTLQAHEAEVKGIEDQINLEVRAMRRPQAVRAWIRLAQMESYLADARRRQLGQKEREDLEAKERDALSFRAQLEGRRAGRAESQQRWWGGRVLDRAALGALTPVGNDGNQARIHLPSRYPGLLYKEYKQRSLVKTDALDRLIWLRRRFSDEDRLFIDSSAAWPAIIVGEDASTTGFLMAAAAAQYFHTFPSGKTKPVDLQFLVYPPKVAWGSMVLPTLRQRVELCLSVVRIFELIHGADGIVGDVSAANILWSLTPTPQAYLLDCDGIRIAGSGPVLPQMNTPHWIDPRDPERATKSTDCYKLAQVIVRVLSVEAYREPDGDLSALSVLKAPGLEQVGQLLRSMSGPGVPRPKPEDWRAALEHSLKHF